MRLRRWFSILRSRFEIAFFVTARSLPYRTASYAVFSSLSKGKLISWSRNPIPELVWLCNELIFPAMARKYKLDEYAIKYLVGHKFSDITEKVYTQRESE